MMRIFRSYQAAAFAALLSAIIATGCSSPGSSTASSATPTTTNSSTAQPTASSAATTVSALSGSLAADYAGTNVLPTVLAPKPKPGEKIWIVVCTKAAPGCEGPAVAAQQAGAKLGWKVTIADGNFDIGDGYNVAIRQAIAAGANAIGLFGIDCVNAKGGLLAAKAAGIPTIGITAADCPGQGLFTAVEEMTPQYPGLAAWWEAWGAAKARWLIHASGGKAQVLDTNLLGGATAYYARLGFLAELKTCGGCKVVSTLTVAPQDTSDGAYAQKFAAALVANPTVNAVVVPFDTLLLFGNVPAAVAATGRKITIVGGEGLALGLGYLKAGRVAAEVAFSDGWLGWGAIDTFDRVLAGQPAVPEGIGWQTIDAAHNLPAGAGAYVPSLDYQAAYLKLWGMA